MTPCVREVFCAGGVPISVCDDDRQSQPNPWTLGAGEFIAPYRCT